VNVDDFPFLETPASTSPVSRGGGFTESVRRFHNVFALFLLNSFSLQECADIAHVL